MAQAATFDEYRPYLFAIAYRMLGSVMDAEDIVQETFLRWQRAPTTEVQSPKAYLAAVTTRLCLDALRSARAKREVYIGPWLPEPLIAAPEGGMEETAVLHESLSMAFLVLLERLTPTERAVFLLHDVFTYDFAAIAAMVGKSEANCRQLASRARREIVAHRPRFEPSPERRTQMTEQFIAACRGGDLHGLLSLLAEDITLWSDGGGKATAARNPIHGAERVAAFLLGIVSKVSLPWETRVAPVNGQPGILVSVAGQLNSVCALDIVDGRIQAIRVVVNPDKLRALS